MKILKRTVIGFVAFIALLLIVSLFLPSKVHVERSLEMKADEAVIFEQINTLKNWEKWSPWHKMDPNMELTYEGPNSGKGAKYSWKSEELGIGSLMITNIIPNKEIKSEMNFMEGSVNNASYVLEKTEEGTKVIWTMDSDFGMNPVLRYFGLFMEGMLGKDFEQGLADLKNLVETLPAPTAEKPSYSILETEVETQPMISIKATCKAGEISQTLGNLYGQLMEFSVKNKVNITGQPFAIYHKYSAEEVELEAALPVDKAAKTTGNIIAGELKAGKVLTTKHFGKYEDSEFAHAAVDEYVTANKKQIIGSPWEVYVTDPGVEKDPSKWLTEIYYPVQ